MDIKELVKLIQSGNLMKFYKGREWMSLRREALQRDNNECQQCKSRGKYRRADCVHHIKEVKTHPALALTLDNLLCLCNTCHNEIHERLDKVKAPKFFSEERW